MLCLSPTQIWYTYNFRHLILEGSDSGAIVVVQVMIRHHLKQRQELTKRDTKELWLDSIVVEVHKRRTVDSTMSDHFKNALMRVSETSCFSLKKAHLNFACNTIIQRL